MDLACLRQRGALETAGGQMATGIPKGMGVVAHWLRHSAPSSFPRFFGKPGSGVFSVHEAGFLQSFLHQTVWYLAYDPETLDPRP